MKQLLMTVAVLAAALPAAAQDYSYGRIRHVEGGTTLQRASEPGSEEAFRNLPFLPGDRIWTDDSGRVEFQFPNSSIVRLDERSKLDYIANEAERGGGRVVLRLWSGSLMLRSRDGRGAGDFEIETSGGLVEARGEVAARVDTANGETRLSVYHGSVSLDDGRRRVRVEAGEQTYARRGEEPEPARRIDRRDGDAFARWDEERERQIEWARAEEDERYVPEEVAPYAGDLRNHGTWHFDVEIGYVWQPRVAAGWRPYLDGRWVWSAYGWTWVPNEIWGWAPSHYGRWGHSPGLGWYWIPGRSWSPAWVSWSYGSDYIGWCPLGRGDRPLVVADSRVLGHAVPRGGAGSPWTYTRRADLNARDLPRRRVLVPEGEAQTQRIVERGHIDRSLRVVEGERAQPRNVQIRPTPGDTIPELRADPMTTIPFPAARRHYPSEDERREREGRDRVRPRYEQGAPQQQAQQPAGDERARRRDGDAEVRTPERDRDRSLTWIEQRRAAQGGDNNGRAAAPASGAAERERSQERDSAAGRGERAGEKREKEREGESPDRDVMRRVFGPISGARGRERDSSESSGRDSSAGRDRGEASSGRDRADGVRSQPRRETPRDAAPPRVEKERERPRDEGSAGATARRKRDPDR